MPEISKISEGVYQWNIIDINRMSNSGTQARGFVSGGRLAAQFASSQGQRESAGETTSIDAGTTPSPA